ncbi:MAG: hypothetical protein ACKN9S_05880, partial [Pirellula sp.]
TLDQPSWIANTNYVSAIPVRNQKVFTNFNALREDSYNSDRSDPAQACAMQKKPQGVKLYPF